MGGIISSFLDPIIDDFKLDLLIQKRQFIKEKDKLDKEVESHYKKAKKYAREKRNAATIKSAVQRYRISCKKQRRLAASIVRVEQLEDTLQQIETQKELADAVNQLLFISRINDLVYSPSRMVASIQDSERAASNISMAGEALDSLDDELIEDEDIPSVEELTGQLMDEVYAEDLPTVGHKGVGQTEEWMENLGLGETSYRGKT